MVGNEKINLQFQAGFCMQVLDSISARDPVHNSHELSGEQSSRIYIALLTLFPVILF